MKFKILIVLLIPILSNIAIAGKNREKTPVIKKLNSPDRIPDRYIVIYNTGMIANKSLSDNKTFTEINTELTTELAVSSGSGLYMRYSSQNVFGSVLHNTDQLAIQALYDDPRVSKIYADTMNYPSTTQSNPTWGLDRIDQTNLPLNAQYSYGNDGTDINVFVIDSGINSNHTEFSGKTIPEVNFSVSVNSAGSGGGDIPPCTFFVCQPPIPTIPTGDTLGHGTHVAATIGGVTYGVAKHIKLHSIKIFLDGGAPYSVIIKALTWLNNEIENNSSLLPAIVNMSYGGSVNNATARLLYQSLNDKGVHLVASAGNNNSSVCGYPARYNNVISIGATTINDYRANFSNKGTCVDLFAPGENIVSANFTGGYTTKSGTSMSAPHVTGALALYLEINPNSTPGQTKIALLAAASNIAITNAGTGSPNKLLNISALSPITPQISPDEYDDIAMRGYDDDVPGDAEPIFQGTSAQLHNFHDSGDQDWTIFAIGDGSGIDITTTQLGTASTRLTAYRVNSFPSETFAGSGRWVISLNDLIQVDSDQTNGNNAVTVQNTTGQLQAYVIKSTSSGPSGYDTDYQIVSTSNDPIIEDQYDDLSIRGYDDDVPGDAEPIAQGVSAQLHNFHDTGDQDWTIFAIGDGSGIDITTTQLGTASARLTAYRVNSFPSETFAGSGRWIISLNDLIQVDSDQTNNNNIVTVQNTTGQIQAYVIKATSSGPSGNDTDYQIISTTNNP